MSSNDNIPELHLLPKFIRDLLKDMRGFFRRIKLKRYKKKKVNQSATDYNRFYYMQFKIHVEDDFNPQKGDAVYEMVVPAKAIFFAKSLLEKNIKEKVCVDLVGWEEITDEEYDELLETKKEYISKKLISTDLQKNHPST